jgi:hypothetical protein
MLTPNYGDVLLVGVSFTATLQREAAGVQLAHCLAVGENASEGEGLVLACLLGEGAWLVSSPSGNSIRPVVAPAGN